MYREATCPTRMNRILIRRLKHALQRGSRRPTGDVARGRAADGAVLLVVEDAVGAALRVPAGERTAADTAAGTAPERAAHGLGVLVGAVDASKTVAARIAWRTRGTDASGVKRCGSWGSMQLLARRPQLVLLVARDSVLKNGRKVV